MSFLRRVGCGYDGQSELGGALGDLADDALAVAFLEVVLALVGVFLLARSMPTVRIVMDFPFRVS
jgi:hypothetical protein